MSIENQCKNALDDQAAGLISALFHRSRGLPALLVRSLEGARCGDKPMRELRSEVLKLIDFLILDSRARERESYIGEYAADVARACLRVFRVEIDSSVRAEAISTLINTVELRDAVPDISQLCAVLFPPREECDPVRRPSPVQMFWGHLASESKSSKGSSETVRGGCMRVLGILAILFPVSVCDEPIYEKGQLYRCCDKVR